MVRKFILHKNEMVQSAFMQYASPLLANERVLSMSQYIQHGNTSCLSHCMAVAYFSLAFCYFLHISCDVSSLVRGALLHDYFLYDWHANDHSSIFRLHGFKHARIAYENANRDFQLSQRSGDIILKHMFPLNLTPPRCRESFIVSLIDKMCSIYEVFGRKGYAPLFGIIPLTRKN